MHRALSQATAEQQNATRKSILALGISSRLEALFD
jgi:hypothetical protein